MTPDTVTLRISPGVRISGDEAELSVARTDASCDSVPYRMSGTMNVKLACCGLTIVILVSVASNWKRASSRSMRVVKMETPGGSASLKWTSSSDIKGSNPPGSGS